ncbi:MAG: hypothetical protein NTZ39_03090 [Methanoregula sp.]|nr:hypothetical protein [Methanoregula sp.]
MVKIVLGAITYTDRMVVADDDICGVSTRRRTNAYTFDRYLYRQCAQWVLARS